MAFGFSSSLDSLLRMRVVQRIAMRDYNRLIILSCSAWAVNGCLNMAV